MKIAWRPDPSSLGSLIPRYASREFSYIEVGATQERQLPLGYHHVTRQVEIGKGLADFDNAADALMRWAMHRRAGLVVAASSEHASAGVTTVMAFGTRLAGMVIPCRVVWAVDEPDRRGFAYGTLPGHPESGEEAFVVEQTRGMVTMSIRAFSRPGSALVRAAGPLGRAIQGRMTDRYGRSLTQLV
jgi:uncharacterized protein (UPF0548 family)